MIGRYQVDAVVDAITARDVARAELYCEKVSDMPFTERVPSVSKLREIATALNTATYIETYSGIDFECVDYRNVHFVSMNGSVS